MVRTLPRNLTFCCEAQMADAVQEAQKEGAPKGQVTIIVNGRPKHVAQDRISFTELVQLAWGSVDPNTIYTVLYTNGPKDNRDGSMSPGDSVEIKSGMNFNVTPTGKS
jgi:hypothetical protein